ncbi:MAG: DNA mismatch repair protein MutS, partial [Eubacteriales bacterium]|nr:DNA mismatch repair protein MutS [Eubacteriales bacterium]
GSLFWVLDKTKTSMGARLLKKMIESPLISKDKINYRLDAIEEFSNNYIDVCEIREYLYSIYDIERILSKICVNSANPKDIICFKSSLINIPFIKNLLSNFNSKEIKEINNSIDSLEDLFELISKSICDDPPTSLREAGIIKEKYNIEVDRLRESKIKGKEWLSDYENEERNNTKAKALKIKYSKLFGYTFELSNAQKQDLPDYFIRKQTLTNAERYTTEKLNKLQDEILGAEEKLKNIEYELFQEIINEIKKNIIRIKQTSKALALLDVYLSLTYVSTNNHYVRPQINDEDIIDIKNGRHPVIEEIIGLDNFIKNDTYLDNNNYIDIITGPNMAGKSTYMRQIALIVILAHIGSFVPCDSANICLVDRIFTRVGASDDLSTGQSTFMVEMNEVANIMKCSTDKSLLILDEIGRGTSTYDGLSIAWSVIEYISNKIKAKTLFATHYHELTQLDGKLNGVNNYHITIKEQNKDIIFLRKIVRGFANRSYGIEVAHLAGVPEEITNRAKEILKTLC